MTTLLSATALDHAIAQRAAYVLDAAVTLDALGMWRAADNARKMADKLEAWADEITARLMVLTSR